MRCRITLHRCSRLSDQIGSDLVPSPRGTKSCCALKNAANCSLPNLSVHTTFSVVLAERSGKIDVNFRGNHLVMDER
uniref:Uncharacterized protein n=1 Tax=Angiostrongylus cantonensis TaxID=6313 RepID=A0A0K0CZN5_ANGCA